jgi:uncharacterized lipoprotein YddW (UPF0748 family)
MRWVREGILDFVCPMDYTANTDLFAERVGEQVMEVNGTIPIAPGIGAYLLDDEWQFVEQVKVAREGERLRRQFIAVEQQLLLLRQRLGAQIPSANDLSQLKRLA